MRSASFVVRAVLTAALLAVLACSDDERPPSLEVDLPRDLIYVADNAAGLVHVFDHETFVLLGALSAGREPGEVQATPDGSLVWTLSRTDHAARFFPTETLEGVTLDVGVSPVHSYIAPDYATIWIGNDGSASVSIIDVATRSVVETVVTGAGHHKMAFATDDSGDFTFAYVSNITDGSITPVSASGEAFANVEGVGPAPHGMDYAASTTFVYNCSGDVDVPNEIPGIEVIATRDDPETQEDERHSIVERIPLDPGRCGYLKAIGSEGVFFAIGAAGLVGRIQLPSHELQFFEVGGRPDKFEVIDGRIYVADALAPVVTVVDVSGEAENASIATGHPVDPNDPPTTGHRSLRYFQGRIYVPNGFDGSVTVIDPEDDRVIATLEGMVRPVNVAVAGPLGGSTYPR